MSKTVVRLSNIDLIIISPDSKHFVAICERGNKDLC